MSKLSDAQHEVRRAQVLEHFCATKTAKLQRQLFEAVNEHVAASEKREEAEANLHAVEVAGMH